MRRKREEKREEKENNLFGYATKKERKRRSM
jgi:hypothetical protein